MVLGGTREQKVEMHPSVGLSLTLWTNSFYVSSCPSNGLHEIPLERKVLSELRDASTSASPQHLPSPLGLLFGSRTDKPCSLPLMTGCVH